MAIGRVDRLTYYAAPRSPVSWPHLVGVIPGPAHCFQHRTAADVLYQHGRQAGSDATAVRCHVLVGTGGVGKTQLAAHHAQRAWQRREVDLLVWVTAASRQAIQAAYAQAAVEVAGAGPAEPEQAAECFLSWLQSTGRRWLIVLDDVADPADLRGLWPPHHPSGWTLVTTRRRDTALSGADRRLVEVGLFTPDEAAAYLVAKVAAHQRHDDAEQITHLARELGYLPLALAQAAAYLIDLGLDCAAYRRRLADHRRTLPELVPDPGGLPDDHRTTLAATWTLSIDRADRLPPEGLARPMLQLISMLDPNGVPLSVLTTAPVLAYLTERRTCGGGTPATADTTIGAGTRPGHVPAEDASDALRTLNRLSLVDHGNAAFGQLVRVHSLIQRTTREALAAVHRDLAARTAADALMTVWPDTERDTSLAQALRANTTTLHAHAQAPLWQGEGHPVLYRTGASLADTGLLTAAITYWQQLHAIAHHRLGPDHLDTLTTRYEVTFWRRESGDATADLMFEELLQDGLRVLGPDHPGVLLVRHELAFCRAWAGDRAGAVSALHDLVADRLRLLGPDHPDTLITRSSLATCLGEAGDAPGAAAMLQELLPDMLRCLGPDHRETLHVRLQLAHWQGEAGDPAAAVGMLQDLMTDRLRLLGPDHPTTYTTRHELARWRGEAGDAPGAAAMLRGLLADRLRTLGPNHPRILATRRSLDHWQVQAARKASRHQPYNG
ncbi:tetratricopeptide repeat protein [Streptomyces sp. NPDC057806]|uniref:tetratricopeptide repeat protein n=1 Tax=Streptomyces sp. NPDC057806 TaxID=3346255 RepID=UPI00367E10AB